MAGPKTLAVLSLFFFQIFLPTAAYFRPLHAIFSPFQREGSRYDGPISLNYCFNYVCSKDKQFTRWLHGN